MALIINNAHIHYYHMDAIWSFLMGHSYSAIPDYQVIENPYDTQAYSQYKPILPSSDLMVLNHTACHCQHLL